MELKVSNFIEIKEKFFEEEEKAYVDEVRNYDDKILIVVKHFKTFNDLRNNYLEIVDIVAGYIQDILTEKGFNDNLRWNIYLIFGIEEIMTKANIRLIEKIEKDQYCCKKYVLSFKNIKSLNKEMEKHLPIFLNLDKNNLNSIQIGGKAKIKNKEFPIIIKDYMAKKTMTLKEFLELTFDIKLIEEIYKGEEYED